MATSTNIELWERWSDLWNGNLLVADAIIAPDFVAHFTSVGASPSEVRGPAGLTQWIGGAVAAFTDYQFTTAVGPLVDSDMLAGRWIFRGTYQGGIPGAPPDAIGTRVEYAGMDFLRVEAGQIAEYWLCADILHMLQQLHVLPA